MLAAALACLLFAGCQGGEPEAELHAGVLRVGAVTGSTRWDAEVLKGVRAAIQELDRLGGVDEKVRVRLVVGDARRLVAGGTRVLVLPCDARLQAESAAAARGRRAFVLETCNNGTWRRFANVWPVSVSARGEARALVGYVREQGFETAAVVGRGRMAAAVHAALRRAEIELGPPRHADVVVVALAARSAQSMVSRLRASGVDAPVVATHGMDDRRAIARHADALEGVVFTSFGFPEPGSELDEFYERYRMLTGRRPQASFAALGYDAVRVLDFALIEAASTRPVALAAAMPGLEAYGATGKIAYAESGRRDPAVSVALVRIGNGRLELVERVDV